jgi:hypothetical protein
MPGLTNSEYRGGKLINFLCKKRFHCHSRCEQRNSASATHRTVARFQKKFSDIQKIGKMA